MQTDIINIGQTMDDKNTQYRPAIDAMLSANNLATIDELISQAASGMTPEERAAFEAVSFSCSSGPHCSVPCTPS